MLDLHATHPIVKCRDYGALWAFRIREAKAYLSLLFFGGLFINTLPTTLQAFGLMAYYAHAVLLTGVGTLAIAGLLDVTRMYNSVERQESYRKSNFVSPGHAINAQVWAAIITAHRNDEDPFDAAETVLREYARGIDMGQFNGH